MGTSNSPCRRRRRRCHLVVALVFVIDRTHFVSAFDNGYYAVVGWDCCCCRRRLQNCGQVVLRWIRSIRSHLEVKLDADLLKN